jgi:hypothetical protein
VPEEFADLPLDNMEHIHGRKLAVRKRILTKTNKSLAKYDAWRCFDRKVLKGDGKHYGVATITMAPAALVRTFGIPAMTQILAHGSGQYDFEDNNLDCYSLFDYKQTTLYHGLNHEDEYYETKVNLRKPLHKRKKAWPTIEEFWNDEEPKDFRLICDD